MTQTVYPDTADYFEQAEEEIENLASSGGSPAIVSILTLLLKGVSARAPTASTPYAVSGGTVSNAPPPSGSSTVDTATPYTSGSAVPIVTPTT